MQKKFFKNLELKKKLYFFIFFIFVVQYYDGFLNIYILLRNNYEERMVKHGGFCEKQAYGFIKYINHKYKKIVELNIPVINFLDFPPATGYFYDTKNKVTNNYLIVISPSEYDLKRINFKNYQIIEQIQNCYFLKKK